MDVVLFGGTTIDRQGGDAGCGKWVEERRVSRQFSLSPAAVGGVLAALLSANVTCQTAK